MTPVQYDSAAALLFQFSEWSERNFGTPDPSLPSHTQIVTEFLAGRDVKMLPFVSGVPRAADAEPEEAETVDA